MQCKFGDRRRSGSGNEDSENSSICFAIGSDNVTGDINAVDYDEELKEMIFEANKTDREGAVDAHQFMSIL